MKVRKIQLLSKTSSSNCKGRRHKTHKITSPKNPVWVALYILWIVFILISQVPFIAENFIESSMEDSYDYHLSFPSDGRSGHYYVERYDTSQPGKIYVKYTTNSNSLEVDCTNIKVLKIYCREMYEKKSEEVFKRDRLLDSNYYKTYFIDRDLFHAHVYTDQIIEKLEFIDTPIPYNVTVNGQEWWLTGINYKYNNDGIVLTKVPPGHNYVDIYFKSSSKTDPVAKFTVSKTVVVIGESVSFDATASNDPDGEIISYVWDFGEGNYSIGITTQHAFLVEGIYNVILTVKDDDYLLDRAFQEITVVSSSDIPHIKSVPNQIRPEDSPPWVLDLHDHEPVPKTQSIEFYWYLTGENTSLYSLTGENSTNDKFVFTPIEDGFGSDLVTLWLWSNENLFVSQPLWINITPINDPPVINNPPNLIIHYDEPYTFDYGPYIYDKETPKNELTLDIFCGNKDEEYITTNGLKGTYNYPQSMLGEVMYATISVSDENTISQYVITVEVTSDNVPKLIRELPDVVLYEGETKLAVFDLNDYFFDLDGDAIFYTVKKSNVNITIYPENDIVDFASDTDWTGIEDVTFRARDPLGAIAEDSIQVTVLPVNDPPTISDVPNLYVHYDLAYRFDLTPYVHDSDNDLSELIITTTQTEHITIDRDNNMVIVLSYSKEDLGKSINVCLIVFDGFDSAFQYIMVIVTEDYPPQLVIPIPDILFNEDEVLLNAINIGQYFEDVDGDALYYTTGNKNIYITINEDLSVDFSVAPDWFGSELVYFRATDPTGGLSEDLVMVNVFPVNDPPVLLPIPKQNGSEGLRWALDLDPYVFDVDNDITELEFSLDNDIVLISGSRLLFLGSKDLPKQIELTVSDGEYNVSQTIEVKVILNKGPDIPTLWDFIMDIFLFMIIIIVMILVIVLLVYRKMTRFSVEELFLIHKCGTLINHLLNTAQANVDDVIFSGMFTAVQEFISDSVAKDGSKEEKDWTLNELKLGDNKMLIERREDVYLAVIFSGEGSKKFRKIVGRVLDRIELDYADELPYWDGDVRRLKGTQEILEELIKYSPNARSKTITTKHRSGGFPKGFNVSRAAPVQQQQKRSITTNSISSTPITTTIPITEAQPSYGTNASMNVTIPVPRVQPPSQYYRKQNT